MCNLACWLREIDNIIYRLAHKDIEQYKLANQLQAMQFQFSSINSPTWQREFNQIIIDILILDLSEMPAMARRLHHLMDYMHHLMDYIQE
jgi:hypothetical protein